ncbi:MAG TPA: 5-(carboxyamino)imidazole ribonucleotide mutase [Deltaproteobacteria bacterium]|nr:5-(carboxyamino)imidazole ribonucleotide mutase [Deltaproteobacteria bacterium]
MDRPLVGILMGSDSDLPVMRECAAVLEEFGIPYEMTISSAHRTPDRTKEFIHEAEKKGIKVFIAGAGLAAHLAGFVAAHTTLPVIGIPLEAGPLKGMDSLLSTVQMPPGVPVATVAIGKAGARNAGILAAQILATADEAIRGKLTEYRRRQAQKVVEKAEALRKEG